MKSITTTYILPILCAFVFLNVGSQNLIAQSVPHVKNSEYFFVEDFDTLAVNTLPPSWRNRDGDIRMDEQGDNISTYHYNIVEEDGNHFLRFDGINGKHMSYPLKNQDINIYDTPYLNWKWRAVDIPEGANEDDNDKNDAVLSVYLVYKVLPITKIPKVIRYTWSSTLPEGKVLSKNFNKQKIVVVNTGIERKGEWITLKRNVIEDHKRFFGGEPPKKPIAILILSDGDSMNKRVIGDYDDFYFSKN